MKQIAYLVPYFGKLPASFGVWNESVSKNPTIDFYLITDVKKPQTLAPNIHYVFETFEELQARVQAVMPEIQVKIPRPYRLCDFKPAYGLIFSELLAEKKYDFWGYCDLDLIFGNIRSFLTEDILSSYEKIGFLGHSTLFKNTLKMRELFRGQLGDSKPYRICYSSGQLQNSFFDEEIINEICRVNKIHSYNITIFADISPAFWNFRLSYLNSERQPETLPRIFTVENGSLYSYYSHGPKVYRDEFMYIHFLRRQMQFAGSPNHDLLIYPNKVVDLTNIISKELISHLGRNRPIVYWSDFISRKWRKVTPRLVFRYILNRIKSKK